MSEFSEIVRYCEGVVSNSKHISRREQTLRNLSRLRDAIERYYNYDPPPDLGVHVTDGIKPEMKAGK